MQVLFLCYIFIASSTMTLHLGKFGLIIQVYPGSLTKREHR